MLVGITKATVRNGNIARYAAAVEQSNISRIDARCTHNWSAGDAIYISFIAESAFPVDCLIVVQIDGWVSQA